MTALAAAFDARRQEGKLLAYRMAAGAKIYKGALVCVTSATGLAATGADAAGVVFVGVAYETSDNTGGGAGARSIRVQKTGDFTFNSTGAAQADVGKTAYLGDDNTAKTAATTNNIPVGKVVAYNSAASVAVRIDGAVN